MRLLCNRRVRFAVGSAHAFPVEGSLGFSPNSVPGLSGVFTMPSASFNKLNRLGNA